MIICDFLDKNVERHLDKESGNTVLTIFKEIVSEYNKNKIVFIDDILDENDYKHIDEKTARFAEIVLNVYAEHVDFEGFRLSLYNKLYLERNTGIFKFKHAIDKIMKEERKKKIVIFDPGNQYTRLTKWLENEYEVEKVNPSVSSKKNIQSEIKECMEKSHFAQILLDYVFKDRRKTPCKMLWLGTRSIKSKLMKELEPDFKFQLLENDIIHKLAFIKYGFIKYEVLSLNGINRFSQKWTYLEKRYDAALEKIASLAGIDIGLVPVMIIGDKDKMKHLLQTLCILEDNKDNLGLLFVEQSVLEEQIVAVDFYNQNGFYSIAVPHGIICIYPQYLEFGNTTKVAVYGERDTVIKNYIDESKIIATGCPHYDRIFNIKDEQKTSEFLLLALQWTAMFPSCDSEKVIFNNVTKMLKLLKHFDNEKLVIKLHPGQSKTEENYIRKLINSSEVGNRVEVKKNEDMFELLKKAKIVFQCDSSVGIEAILMGKPLIVLDFDVPFRWIEFNGCVVVKDYHELVQTTQNILVDEDKYMVENHDNIEKVKRFFSADLKGESYKNVASVCRELCHMQKK